MLPTVCAGYHLEPESWRAEVPGPVGDWILREREPLLSKARCGRMSKRMFDIVISGMLLVLAAPVLAIAAVGVRLSSPGPVIFRARRSGLDGRLFTMHKLRTMHSDAAGPRITAVKDARVFPFGSLLRRTKIDELPQLYDVLRGRMSVVGPRPEDPDIVERHYSDAERETLGVLPGLVSPGTIFAYTHGDSYLGADPEGDYCRSLLPVKLALDRLYVHQQSLGYDLRLIVRAAVVVLLGILGRRRFPDPPELPAALLLVARR